MSSHVIPCLRYHDAPKAIDWLCDTFGFVKRMVVEQQDGGIAHAELILNDGMVMLGSAREDEYGKQLGTADPTRPVTQSIYMIVDDADAMYARVREAGATIVMELTDTDYGSRDFSCRDLEGHVWSFGTYNPWGNHAELMVE
jgi:uncharacterized glyoxalase superfamily protein PhnB